MLMRLDVYGGRLRDSNTRRIAYGITGVWLCLLLAACASGNASGGTPTVPTGTGTTSGSTPPPTASGPTATPYISGSPGIDLGAANACADTGTPSASLPGTIPAYPGAEQRVGQVNGSNGVFGLCTSDSVDAVDRFYAAQLPSHGWQQVTNVNLQASRQLTGTNGAASLVLTISPVSTPAGKSQILIIYTGGS